MAEERKTAPNTNLEYAEHTREERNEEVLETGNEPKKDVDPEDKTTISLQTYEAQQAKWDEKKEKEEAIRQQMINDALNSGPQTTIDTDEDGNVKNIETDNNNA